MWELLEHKVSKKDAYLGGYKMAKGTTKRLDAKEKKEQLLSGLVDVRSRILKEASRFSAEMMEVPFVGTWPIRDLLAHLSGWDITNLKAAREILEGNVPGFYANYDRDWRSYNATLIREYKRDDLRTQLSLTRETHNQLIGFLKTIPAQEFFKDRGIRSRGYKVIISRLLEVEQGDEEIHLNQIREYAESLQSPA
jgi:hypothetical protein